MRGPLNRTNPDKPALVAGQEQYTYDQVDLQVQRFASGILAGADDLSEERIAFLIPASPEYVTVMHGIWRAGGIAIPLNTASADAELEHCLTSTGVNRLIAVEPFLERIRPLCDKLGVVVSLVADHLSDNLQPMPEVSADRRALIIFTSGTTNLPKGVVTTHKNINAQITTLVDAWAWSENDVIPLFLPLHHVHGIINVLSCALWAGATVHLMERLDIEKLCGEAVSGTYNLFMAVPTIYVKLIDHIEGLDAETAQPIKAAFGAMRLNVSGSAACPVAIFEAWQRLTGQVLLERYGMTEIGMALSNPYVGERRAGSVGQPFPGVTVQLFNEDHQPVTEASESGEIRVKSDTVFLEYWNNPKATAESFRDGWFCTGDIAVIEGGYFRIMGRSSIDIIKSGGYKLSALEIEGKLLAHPAIAEVAVLGIEDRTWGESVAAVAVLREGQTLNIEALKTWCEGKLSSYKLPKTLVITSELPRNAMGKIVKPKLKALF
jgi:malonyl-CoA/methylmalonyl-CoA synthetase